MRYAKLSPLVALTIVTACARTAGTGETAPSAGAAGAEITDPGYGPRPALPPPDTTHQVSRFPRVLGWPEGRTPVAPPGFTVARYTDDVVRPRWLHVLPNGDVLVAESANNGAGRDTLLAPDVVAARWAAGNRGHSPNRITLLRDADGDGKPELRTRLLWGLNRPLGMAYLDGWLYVGNMDELVRYPFQPGDTAIQAPPRHVLPLPAGGYNNHWTRNVVANAEGTKLYVTVGSATNVDTEGIDAKDDRRAAVLELNPDGSGLRVFATGLRNPVGLGWVGGTLWTVVNERDGLGDDLVPDYLTSVREGAFYGWPYSYFGQHEDPRQAGGRPDLVAQAVVPDYALGSHTASLGLAFYGGDGFPDPWAGGAYIGQHGSWNRSSPAGYRVLYVPFEGGRPSGPPREFLGGFVADSGRNEVYGRPLGVAVHPDGSLLVADDAAHVVWRVRYAGGAGESREAAVAGGRPVRVATVTGGLAIPESARWDPEQRVWFVSNVNGGPHRDGNGFISRLTADGRMDSLRFVASGRGGVTLHAPRGMAIVGDTLWVADIDAVRGFHRRTGEPLASVDLSPLGPRMLNDVTASPDGSLYVTDTGVQFDPAGTRQHPGPDRVFRIRGGNASVALEGDWLGQPNGITWDPVGKRLLLAPIVGDSSVQQWTEGAGRPEPVARGPGRYDGVEVLPDGRILVASWNDSTVSEVAGKEIRPVIRGVPAPADIGVDPEGRIVAVPLLRDDRVELWRLPE